jgi:ribonuclease HII
MIIVGIDEAGRGCWAGPLVASAVILGTPIKGLNDSKLLSKQQRQFLSTEIKKTAAAFGIGWVGPKEIDEIGLTLATQKAMKQALSQISAEYEEIVIDGNYNYLPDNLKVKTLIKADSLVPAVSAASILAKVARDEYMIQAAQIYPEYQFERHVGYGTALHHQLLKLHGACELHRLSYKPLQLILRANNV